MANPEDSFQGLLEKTRDAWDKEGRLLEAGDPATIARLKEDYLQSRRAGISGRIAARLQSPRPLNGGVWLDHPGLGIGESDDSTER